MKSSKDVLAGIILTSLFLGACSFNHPTPPPPSQPSASKTTRSDVPAFTNASVVTAATLRTNEISKPPTQPTNTLQTNLISLVVSNVRTLTSQPETNLQTQYEMYQKGQITKGQIMQAVWDTDNAKPQDLYGKVVDQYGQPVVGAKVQGNLTAIAGFEQNKDEILYTETDFRGQFRFVGLHGNGLGIWPKKEGYSYDLKMPSRRPDDYQPDAGNPVIFTMWKLKGAEPMVHVKAQAAVACDESPTAFDLLTGKKNPNGDLIVRLTRNPINIVRGKPFDWSVTLEIKNGGLAEIAGPYPNEAPTEGYQPVFTTKFPSNMPQWTAWLEQHFYFKSKGGQVFGRMDISITADFQPPPTFFSAEIYANPAGSRNLEFDPDKQIR